MTFNQKQNGSLNESRLPEPAKTSPIKIQGIKTKLVPFILNSIKWDGQGRWIEPFVGSGVVLFNAAPKRAIAADTNKHIIRVYQALQNNEITPNDLRKFLEREGHSLKEKGESHYYEVRSRFNESHSPFDFIFLNRSCFNGVVRFNSRGNFNVPFCRKPERFAQAYITKICNQAAWVIERMRGKGWEFIVQDWRETLSLVSKGDFVYLDPPYNDRHTDYFNRWSIDDADDLAEAIKSLKTGFAYSTWKQNQYRVNEHLVKHFIDYPTITTQHFYHVGSTAELRNSMEEALVISPDSIAEMPQPVKQPNTARKHPTLFM
jgi:DNA adenine methylase